MPIVLGTPHPALRGLVTRYAGFAERTPAPRETREAASRGIAVIIDLDAGWTVEGDRFGSFAGGMYARPVRVRHEGSSEGLQVDIDPIAARALLGVPAGELRERTVGLEDLLGPAAGRLAERLHAAPPGPERFRILDEALLARLADARGAPPPDVERAWRLLCAGGGRARVEAIADTLGCSRRHLSRRFAAEIGVSPKVAARLIRFDSARARLGEVPLARLAAEHGFADQAHLAREFRALAGAPPTQVPFVQDAGVRAA